MTSLKDQRFLGRGGRVTWVRGCWVLVLLVLGGVAVSARVDRFEGLLKWGEPVAERSSSVAIEPDAIGAADEWLLAGRGLLLAGEAMRAERLFERVAEAGDRELAARAMFYLALCRDRQGDRPGAVERFERFARGAGLAGTGDAVYFAAMFGCSSESILESGLASTMLVAQPPAAPGGAAAIDLPQVVTQIRDARKKFDATDNPSNRIVLGTWLMLFGELASDEQQVGMFTRSIDAIAEGRSLIDAIDAGDSKTKALLAANPLLALRFDAARVRQPQVNQKQAISRQQERDRLNQLRQLARGYKDLLHQLALAHAGAQAGDSTKADAAGLAALTQLAMIDDVAGKRQDYYLFNDEPNVDGDDADFKVVQVVPAPYSNSLASHLKGVQSLLAFENAAGDDDVYDAEGLQRALKWAAAALPEAGGDADAPGRDVGNVLAHLARGLALEAVAVQRTRERPFDAEAHAAAKAEFDPARQALTRAAKLLSDAGQDDGPIQDRIAARLVAMTDLQAVLTSARQLETAGQSSAAWSQLRRAARRQLSPELVFAALETGRRAGEQTERLLGDLDQAIASGVVPDTDVRVVLLRARISLAGAWGTVQRAGAANLDPAVRRQVLEQITGQARALVAARASAADRPASRAVLESYHALATAFRMALDPALIKTDKPSLQAAYDAARNAAMTLEAGLKDQDQAVSHVAWREGLIAGRLAMGYLAVGVLPEFRNESQLAFAAALDEQARLNSGTAAAGLTGSPLVTAILSRPSEANAQLARNERSFRQALSWATESMLALHYGQADVAGRGMGVARQAARSRLSGDRTGVSVDAARLLDAADSADQQQQLLDQLALVHVRTLVAADQADQALVLALETVQPGLREQHTPEQLLGALDEALLKGVIDRFATPVHGYALGLALEEYAASLPAGKSPRRLLALAQANSALARTGSMLTTEAARQQFAWLPELVTVARARLADPAPWIVAGKKHEDAGRLGDAVERYGAGLRRHPGSGRLWTALLAVELEKLERTAPGQLDEDQAKQFLTNAATAASEEAISAYQVASMAARLAEHRGRLAEAEAAWDQAVAATQVPAEQVIAVARRSVIRARLAVVAGEE